MPCGPATASSALLNFLSYQTLRKAQLELPLHTLAAVNDSSRVSKGSNLAILRFPQTLAPKGPILSDFSLHPIFSMAYDILDIICHIKDLL